MHPPVGAKPRLRIQTQRANVKDDSSRQQRKGDHSCPTEYQSRPGDGICRGHHSPWMSDVAEYQMCRSAGFFNQTANGR
jgi:hypothetical protein